MEWYIKKGEERSAGYGLKEKERSIIDPAEAGPPCALGIFKKKNSAAPSHSRLTRRTEIPHRPQLAIDTIVLLK